MTPLTDRARELPNYERIWLQPFAGDEGGHTWCSERIEDDDIEYVRADVHAAAILEAEKRGAAREREACAQIGVELREGNAMLDNEPPNVVRGYEAACLEYAAAIRNRESDK